MDISERQTKSIIRLIHKSLKELPWPWHCIYQTDGKNTQTKWTTRTKGNRLTAERERRTARDSRTMTERQKTKKYVRAKPSGKRTETSREKRLRSYERRFSCTPASSASLCCTLQTRSVFFIRHLCRLGVCVCACVVTRGRVLLLWDHLFSNTTPKAELNITAGFKHINTEPQNEGITADMTK